MSPRIRLAVLIWAINLRREDRGEIPSAALGREWTARHVVRMAMMLSVASAFLPVLFFSVRLANTENDFLEVYIISFAQAMRACVSNLAEMGSMSFFSLCCQCTVNTLRVAVIQEGSFSLTNVLASD